MARNKVEGICHICGVLGQLTFEHVPPEAAFNNRKVHRPKFEDYMDKGPDFIPSYAPIQQRGSGGHTLCGYCNNNTGNWYVPAYVDVAYQAAILLQRSKGKLTLHYPYRMFPLRFIKQVIAMFCSINNPGFIRKNPELIKFLLNKEAKYIDPRINIFAYLTTSTRSRQSGFSTAFNGDGIKLYSEMGFAPLGFIMTIDSFPPDNRLVDISYFARYDYDDFDIFYLKFPVLPISFYLPGDFRSRDEIMKDYRNNMATKED